MTREEDIRNAVEVLRKGGVILYPTDTVWGIGCDATNAEAVKRVYEIKQREDSKALICLVDSDARLQRYVRRVPDVAWQLIDSLQDSDSAPTTIIFDGAVNLAPNLIAEDGSIALRITQEAFSKELCYRFQKALVSTSANISGQPAAQNYGDIAPNCSRPLTTCAGRAVRSTNPTARAASSGCVRTARSASSASRAGASVSGKCTAALRKFNNRSAYILTLYWGFWPLAFSFGPNTRVLCGYA